MPRDHGRQDMKTDIRKALAESDGFDFEALEPHDYVRHADAVLAVVLPYFEDAYQRGVMGERSKAGYKAVRKIKEEQ